MMLKIGALLASALAFLAALFFARREGMSAAKVDALRREIERNAKEQERNNAINNSVANMSDDDVRKRLQDVSGKQR